MIDTCLLSLSCGPAIVKCLQVGDVRYEVDKQPETNMMSFWREVTVATEIESNKVWRYILAICKVFFLLLVWDIKFNIKG